MHTTLRVGGTADAYYRAADSDELAEVAGLAQRESVPYEVLGLGSNVLLSDRGVRGLVLHFTCSAMSIGPTTVVDCGASFQDLFLATAQAGLSGLEFAVGIPGTVGGALVSNAGAYRANIEDLIESIEVVEGGERKTVEPQWMEFSYRDSCLRKGTKSGLLLQVTLRLTQDNPKAIYDRARDFQLQRRLKQPPGPSAGSFFKNVYDDPLLERLPDLPAHLLEARVVPAGYLIAAAGLKGTRVGGAAIAHRHANFLMNLHGATAADIRSLADLVKKRVAAEFGVLLEEEVLYFGDWTTR